MEGFATKKIKKADPALLARYRKFRAECQAADIELSKYELEPTPGHPAVPYVFLPTQNSMSDVVNIARATTGRIVVEPTGRGWRIYPV